MSKSLVRWMMLFLQNMPFILLITVVLIFSILSPRFFTYKNFENVLTQASYIGIVGVGMTFVLLTGGVDLSVGSTMYLSATITGTYLLGNGLPLWLAVPATLVVGMLVGSVNAFAVTYLRIVPFIVTLGTLALMRGLALSITQSADVTFPASITDLGSHRLFGFVPLPIAIFAVVVLVAWLILTRTTFGRQIYAVGNDSEGAKKAGINVGFILASVYVICGACAALGGLVSVAQFGVANAGFGQHEEFNAIAVAVLGGTSLFGGRGSVFPGTVVGTILVQLVTSGLIFTRVDIYLQPLVYAAIIFLAVLLDSLRTIQLERLERRTIRVEKAA
ncbi:ABC transporter permease [Thermogemmatispora sp.]|uniref:ABC transporter permease n=1 Tax=Thermogemmatispora sp. TaxID=1968838 RepID=UPI0035E442D6